MTERTLQYGELMICRMGNEREIENYLILVKQKMIDNTYTYKVQWWNSLTKFFWTQYDMTLEEALIYFHSKIIYYKKDIEKFANTDQSSNSSLPLKWEEMISKQYFKEKLHHFLGLMKDDMLSKEDLQEIIDELTPICLEHIFRGSIFCINCKEEKESEEEKREVEPIDITDSPIYDEDNNLDENYENKTHSDI